MAQQSRAPSDEIDVAGIDPQRFFSGGSGTSAEDAGRGTIHRLPTPRSNVVPPKVLEAHRRRMAKGVGAAKGTGKAVTAPSNITWREVAGQALGRWNPGPELRAAGFTALDLWASPPGPQLSAQLWANHGFAGGCPQGASKVAQKLRTRRLNQPLGKREAERIGAALTAIAREASAKRRAELAEAPMAMSGAADRPRYRRARNAATRQRRNAEVTFNDVFDHFINAKDADMRAGRLSVNYINSLRNAIFALRPWCGDMVPLALTRDILETQVAKWQRQHGANGAAKRKNALVSALQYCQGRERFIGWLPPRENYTQLNIAKPPKRLRVGTAEEMETLLLAFDDPGAIYDMLGTPLGERNLRPCLSAGDAFTALLWTCARVGDGVSLRHDNIIEASGGGRMIDFRPSKSKVRGSQGQWIQVPIMPPLAERLAEIPARQRAIGYRGLYLFVREDDREPYVVNDPNDPSHDHTVERKHQRFTRVFNERRALAAKIVPSLLGGGTDRRGRPLVRFNAQDTRDTAATRLYAATGSLEAVGAWHGSSARELASLFGHYIEVQPEFSAQVGDQLLAYCERQGIKV